MATIRRATLLFLVKEEAGQVCSVCLGMKKRGFGAGRWNGAGGKVKADESVEEAARREMKEEFGVEVGIMVKRAQLDFKFPHRPDFDQVVEAFVATEWVGEPTESEEMKPQWWGKEAIPYKQMWADDELWLPQVLEGKCVKGVFEFTPTDGVARYEVSEVGAMEMGK